MKLRSILLVFLMSLTSLTFAKLPKKPNACPSLNAIKSKPFNMVLSTEHGYITAALSQYNTSQRWAFLMGYFKTYNAMDALSTGNQYLMFITGNPSPKPSSDQTEWTCVYDVPGSYYGAVAVTQSKNHSKMNTQYLQLK